MKKILFLGILTLLLSACGMQKAETPSETGTGMGMGNNGMMQRHHAQVPEEYAGKANPVPADDASLERGAALFTANCASCHGDGGMGDGPAGAALNPAPAPVAHTSQMMNDDYLFWRISEGGVPFNTAMPVWKELLDEQARWDLINYVRALGAGKVKPANGSGGETFDPATQAKHQAEVLAQAVQQGIVTQAEADTFVLVHNAVDQYRTEHPEMMNNNMSATERETAILAALVESQVITQEQADAFPVIHDKLGNAGFMP